MGDKEEKKTDFEELLQYEKNRSEDYLNRLKYLQADFENLKKRHERECEQIKNFGTERLVLELLDVVDELELAVKNGEISTSTEGLLEGVEMTLRKLRKVLEQEGAFPIENPEGKPFDPQRHHAIAAVESSEVPESTVVEQVRKGYTLRGRVIRPTIVKVAVKPQNQSNKTEEKIE
jgi:molecular chaperone GrpE